MKKTKILSLLLCLSIFCTLIVPGTRAHAESDPDNGMKISKTATANGDGSYTITLEAFAIGSKVITEQKTDIPTDIVLVIDQSGSMEDPIGGYTYTAYREDSGWFGIDSRNYYNEEYYPLRHNGGSENLWHKLNDNEYVAVSVEQEKEYTAISGWDNREYYENQNNLYCLVNGEYKRVNVTSSWGEYEYYVDGSKIGSGTYSWKEPTFDNGYAPLYQFVKKYTYSYTLNGVTTVIEEPIGDGSSPNTQFYRRDYSSSAGGTRLNALKNAATTFANAVAAKAAGEDGNINTPADNVNHRIAVVGFASGYSYEDDWGISHYYNYGNTEVFVGATQYTYNAGGTNNASNANSAQSHYSDVFQSMDTTRGQTNITASIGKLDANGGTLTNLGMEMANGILNANPVPEGEQRNRVIIVFTDGAPGWSGYDSDIADDAISQASTAKADGVTVYTVGIFPGADATSAGNQNGDETEKANWFMQKVSSNNGTPRTPSYYLSAADAGTLNNIFQQISNQIETGGSSSTLTSEAVVKDIISPQFTLPANATADSITLETYRCTGKDSAGNYTWSKNDDAMGASPSIGSTDESNDTTKNNQVSVTGFNFSENWVGTETNADGTIKYRGNKLVIKFTVKPRPGFLGGNAVYTNTSAGVYENGSATDPVLTFKRPDVDVTIKEPTITLPDANVYLGAYFSETVNAEDLKKGTKVKFGGDIELDLTKPNENWGLESWQTEYVTIEVKVTDKDGHEVTNFEKLTEDTEYKVSVSIKPKTSKEGNSGYDESMAGKIHVFKPELTFQDSTAYYGDTAPSDLSGNLTNTEWKHGETKSTDSGVTMIGTAPTLDLTYTPEAGKIAGGKINTKEDISVDVSVKIGTDDVTDETSFVHTKCDETCTDPANGKFWIHVKTCTLSITKQGGTDGEPYVFTVYKDGAEYTEATIVGNNSVTIYELPVGAYTIKEDIGWSWRYNADNGSGEALSAAKPNGTITCTNSSNGKIYWLNGFSEVVRNIFDTNH